MTICPTNTMAPQSTSRRLRCLRIHTPQDTYHPSRRARPAHPLPFANPLNTSNPHPTATPVNTKNTRPSPTRSLSGSLGSAGELSRSRNGKKRIATKKFEIQLHDNANEESTGMAGGGTSSEMRRKGIGPRPMEKEAWG